MSEEKEFKWQVFLFILLAAVVVFIVGLILIVTGYNTYFNYLYYGDALLYTIFSAIILFLIIILWQETSVTFFSAQGTCRWLLQGLYLLCIAGCITPGC